MSVLRLLLLVLVVAAAMACNRGAQAQKHPGADGSDRCAAVETLAIQGGQHLLGDQPPPVPYSSIPPTSGWHSSGAFAIAVQPDGDPLSEPEQVSVLEAGGAVVSYNGVTSQERQRLVDHVTANYAGRVAVTSYDKLDEGEVALTAWGLSQRCDGLDLAVLDGFAGAYADESPEVPGAVD